MVPVKASLRYPIVTLVLTLMVVAAGVHAFLTMPRTEDPSITVRTGLVLAAYPGATSAQVEEQVTRTLEEHIFKFPEVRKQNTFSTSRPGLVIINVELESNVTNADVFWSKLRHELNETAAAQLPAGVRGPIVNSDFGDTVAMLIAVHGKRYGYRELRDYVDTIQDEFRTIREVGKLAAYGEQSEQVWITSSLERMSQYFADPLRVIQALQMRNVVLPSGHLETESARVPLRTTGLFTTEAQIRNVLVDVSRTGQPVYIRDLAEVERRYQDPTFLVRYDGEPSVLLSVEMQKGKNIVRLGEEIEEVMNRLKVRLPPDLHLDRIADQPMVVKNRISDLRREFLLAIASVILVTLILLPLRVAVIAALAIPVTILTSLSVLDFIGVQLHQVSIAALIVVLGIVVDDAIVIADNYVELLDRGVPKADAAWRSASDVFVPVLTATLTIVASFLPLLVISGSAGEFIRALPISVAVALSVSLIVAVMLTPLLCSTFISKGLHERQPGGQPARKKFNLLDSLQGAYNAAIVYFMRWKVLALAAGVVAVVVGVGILSRVPQQFFPTAERNQFVVDLWMPQGTRIEATDAVMRRLEGLFAQEKEVSHYASFVGQSAPRFYYNVNPQQPDGAYGQLIVNTVSAEATPGLVATFRERTARLIPEGLVIVKELQQGQQMEAPVEVRISGDDVPTLKNLGSQVEGILRSTPNTELIHSNFFNDSYMVDVEVNNELANRLGLTNAQTSQLLAGGFDGAPVSTFWEGDRAVTIMLRLDSEHRASWENVRNAYLTSPVTNARVPVRSVATLEPEWQTSRIVRRNGVPTITVHAHPSAGHFASQIVSVIEPKLRLLPLPAGYQIGYGGEKENQDDTLPEMIFALAISVVAIFLILLIQFRSIAESLVVMCSIPLALFGAAFGLWITGNSFGFTAFMGLISLSGIVVRNAIILVDYIKEKMREGHSVEEAATEAGERRLRPIFLTTMAAAVGVTPMILSGSSLWSPLASTIAFGLVFSMFFTLLVVPVLFAVIRRRAKMPVGPVLAVMGLIVLAGTIPAQAETRRLTLPEAIEMALKNNPAARIAQARIRESQGKVASARADYYPRVGGDAYVLRAAETQFVRIPAGAFGAIPGLGPFPPKGISLNQGSEFLLLGNTMVSQPLSQLLKIRNGVRAAESEERISESGARKVQNDIAFAVRQVYCGILAAQEQRKAAEAEISAGEESLREAERSVQAGNALEAVVLGARTSLLQSRQSAMTAEDQVSDLTAELDGLLGLPVDTELQLAGIPPGVDPPLSREQILEEALRRNPEVQAARHTVAKASIGVTAAKSEYIPDVGAFARYTYQNGVPFLTHNNGVFGLQLTWNIFDWGKRRGVVAERRAQLEQAQEDLRRVEDRISVDVGKASRKLARAEQMLSVAAEALKLRRESERLAGNQRKAEVISEAGYAAAVAAARKAGADELQARLACELARAEILRVAGTGAPEP